MVNITSPEADDVTTDDITVTGTVLDGVNPVDAKKVDVIVDGIVVDTVVTDVSGDWSLLIENLTDGAHTIGAKLHLNDYALIANAGDNTVAVFDTESDTVVSIIASANFNGLAQKMGIKPDNSEVWLPQQGGSIAVINTASLTSTLIIDSETLFPRKVIFTPDGTKAFSYNNFGSNQLTIYDTATYTVIDVVDLTFSPNDIVMSPDGSLIYAMSGSEDILVTITTSDYTEGTPHSIGTALFGTSIDLNADGTILYFSQQDPAKIRSFSTIDFSEISSVDTTVEALFVQVNKETGMVYATDSTSKLYLIESDVDDNLSITKSIPTTSDPNALTTLFLNNQLTKLYSLDAFGNRLPMIDAAFEAPEATQISDASFNLPFVGIAFADTITDTTVIEVDITVGAAEDITPPTMPGTPTVTSPTSNKRPVFNWTASTDLSGIQNYHYQLSTASDFSSALTEGDVLTNTFTPSTDLTTGTWYFRVWALDNADNHTSYTSPASVIIFNATFTQPVAGSTIFTVHFAYSFPQSVKAGTKKIIFTPTTPSGTDKVITLLDNSGFGGAEDFFYNPSTNPVVTVADAASANFTSLSDGVYTIKLQYSDASDYVTTLSVTNVTIDTVSNAVTLVNPVASSAYLNLVPIKFTIPETILSNSLKLTFDNISNSNDYIFQLADVDAGALQDYPLNMLSIFPNSKIASITPSITVLPFGTYNVILSYQDAVGNPIATSMASSVTLGTEGPDITINSPNISGNGAITDTTIRIQSESAILVSQVSIDSLSTATYSDFNCSQTNSKTVDCTVKINSSGSLIVRATDSSGSDIRSATYTITPIASPVIQEEPTQDSTANQEGDNVSSSAQESANNPVSAPVSFPNPADTNAITRIDTTKVSDNTEEEIPFPTSIFPWWIVVLAGLLGFVYFVYQKRKKSKEEDIL